MQIEAAVIREAGGPFVHEGLTLDEPREDEVLIRIVSTGLCHSDITASHCHFPPVAPVVLGHEGAGIVERVGANVTHVAPGDHVVLSFNTCGECGNCRAGRVAYCEQFFLYNLNGHRPDGSDTLHDAEGPVHGCFFGQSSFATYAIAHKRNAVKVRKDAPLEYLGPLGCGLQTGAGSVLNVLKPSAGSSFALFGCGGVGLAALMAAKIAGCDPIIAIDRVPSRLELARKLGATRVIDASTENALDILTGMGGIQNIIETTGVPAVLEQAALSTCFGGACVVLGIPAPGTTVTLDIVHALVGKSLLGVNEGNSDPQTFIPILVDHFIEGRFPIDLLTEFYGLEEINAAVADSLSGKTVKPILRIGKD